MSILKIQNCRSVKLALCLLFIVGLAACSEQETEAEGLKIVPVYGAERVDISADVDWFGTKVGTIEQEQRDQDGNLYGFAWKQKLDSYGQDGVYPATEGEIGVQLSLRGLTHYSKHQISVSDGKSQILEIAITDNPRIIISADGLVDDALTDLTIDTPKRGSSTGTTGWANTKGVHYLTDPGRYTIKLTNNATGETQTDDVVLGNGETAEINFKFTK